MVTLLDTHPIKADSAILLEIMRYKVLNINLEFCVNNNFIFLSGGVLKLDFCQFR